MSATLRLILIVIIFVLVGIVLFWIKYAYDDYDRLKTMEKQFEASTKATTETVGQLNTQTAEKQRVEIVVSDRRAVLDRSFEDLKREDQTVADWAATPIPQRVRDIDSENLDRASDPGVGREDHDRATPNRRPRQNTQ